MLTILNLTNSEIHIPFPIPPEPRVQEIQVTTATSLHLRNKVIYKISDWVVLDNHNQPLSNCYLCLFAFGDFVDVCIRNK